MKDGDYLICIRKYHAKIDSGINRGKIIDINIGDKVQLINNLPDIHCAIVRDFNNNILFYNDILEGHFETLTDYRKRIIDSL